MIRDVLEEWIEEDDNYKKMDPDEKAIRAGAWRLWSCADRQGKRMTREAITAQ
ncbi:MAG: hypothetical protein M3275_01935 [Thermoproteota archaeon]|nr:hypothetical protein [Thermoproteota archaeon]